MEAVKDKGFPHKSARTGDIKQFALKTNRLNGDARFQKNQIEELFSV
jgi:hypothetical protein